MNILLLSQFFSTTRGGGEYLFSLIAQILAQNGHNVWVITSNVKGENYKFNENVKVIFVKPDLQYQGGLPPSILDNIRYVFNSTRIGLKLIKKEKIDVIHSNNFAPAFAGSLLSYLSSKPHITSVWDIFTLCGKDYWEKWAQQVGVSRISAFLGSKFEKLALKLPHDAIYTISNASRDDLTKFGAKKSLYVIPPTIIESKSETNSPDPLQFVYMGRLVFYKNLEVIIKAINIIKLQEPKIKLVIAGGGPHRNQLEKLVMELELDSNIEFRGYIDTGEKIKLISTSNALIFPSLCEGFGLVILEAYEQKRPVLVSDIRPMSDIVSNGITGYVLDPHDEQAWANHLLELIRNQSISNTMGQNGYKILNSHYNQDLMYQKIFQMYLDVTNKN